MADSLDLEWNSFSPVDSAVLCFIQQSGNVLLIEKKRGLGAGKVNGPGGKLEPGETFLEAAIRETQEEIGLVPLDPQWHVTLDFVFIDGYTLTVRVFTAQAWEGSLIETDEALPFWVPVTEIPYERMWEDDRLWLGYALEGKNAAGRFVFDDDTMVKSDIQFGTRTFSTGP